MTASVGVVVLNWNEQEYTAECVRSLLRMDCPSFNVIVVDNGSEDDSVARLREAFPDVAILANERNLGFAGGCNRGIEYALANGADYVWLLNNDAVVAPDSLSRQIAAAEAHGKPCVVGAKILDFGSEDSIQTLGGARLSGWTAKVTNSLSDKDRLDYIVGASMLISREVIETVGLLDDWFFFYWEDADYCRRARAAGFDLIVAEDSRVYHRRGGSSDDATAYGRSALADFHLMRGAVRYMRTYEGWKWPVPALALFVKCALLGILRRKGVNLDRIPTLVQGALSGWRDDPHPRLAAVSTRKVAGDV